MNKMNNNRSELIRSVFIKYYPKEANYKESGIYSSLSNLDYDEEEVTFHDLVAKILADKLTLTTEDKKLMDEIGESIWNGDPYWQHRMQTKYWKVIVE